ncbi:MAG TPA: VOC family protein [Polyangiaceae bacterium]|nr:VOC family protein [Polyangiaceae bacterium]
MANPFAHIELNTDDVAKAQKFYKSVFDWKFSAMPEQDYTMIDVGAGTGGGMMKKPMAEAPTQWLPYVMVESVKKTIEKARKAGANVIVPFQSIGDMGAIGIFVDPTGAGIGVWEQNEAAPAPAKRARKKVPAKKTAKKAPTKKTAKKAAKRK